MSTKVCDHGHLARTCELCEAKAEIERLRADVASLTAAHDMWHSQWKDAQQEIERLRALLKYARIHTAQGWYADRTKEKWLADIDAALRWEGKP